MSNEICMMCEQTIDDRIQFGEKITIEDITAHYFCVLFSSNLPQNGADDEGIFGFMIDDIKKEARRAKKQRCTFCGVSGANVSCCASSCRKAFHFTCGSKGNCHFEFVDPFKAFCHRHSNIAEPDECHLSTDLCMICHDKMGDYSLTQSIESPCCKSNWFHKRCLQGYADSAGYFLKCPCCNDSDTFRNHIKRHGVFIPERDAKWEETGQNTFYGFEQHTERPKECVAEYCTFGQGRTYSIDKNNDYLLIVCECCGSKGVHEHCLGAKSVFVCDDCEPPSKKRKKMPEPIDVISDQENDINNNIPLKTSLPKFRGARNG